MSVQCRALSQRRHRVGRAPDAKSVTLHFQEASSGLPSLNKWKNPEPDNQVPPANDRVWNRVPTCAGTPKCEVWADFGYRLPIQGRRGVAESERAEGFTCSKVHAILGGGQGLGSWEGQIRVQGSYGCCSDGDYCYNSQ